jgi:hypothetical protein
MAATVTGLGALGLADADVEAIRRKNALGLFPRFTG